MNVAIRAVAAASALLCLNSGCAKAPAEKSGIDLQGMDKTVAPGDDFNLYANGGWMKATPIPADKASYGIFTILGDDTRKKLQALLDESTKSPANDDIRKIGDFYSSYMDEAAIEAKGISPLKPQLDGITAIGDKTALSKMLGSRLRADVDALNATNFETENLFGVWITQGLTDPATTYPYLMQGGLGMPDRDYYVSASPHMAELRTKYREHVEAMLKLAGVGDASNRAGRVMALETKMAKVHATRVESEDVHKPETWKKAELLAKAPGLDWAALLDAASLGDAPTFIVWHPKAIPGLSALVASEPLDAWKDWLTYHAISRFAPFLPKAFVDENFAFHGKAMSGIQELRPRWQRGIDLTGDALGEAVGKMYVEKYFPPESKAKVQTIVDDLIKAFGKRIDSLTWMSPATKEKAKAKLGTLKVGVGYPDKWRDYSDLRIVKDDPIGNWERAGLSEYKAQLAKLHKPIDRGEWWMVPQLVNAVNLPLQNALNFPAAILQPPNFDPAADAAHNFGSIGATIGHEISHSFDDQGSQFDAEGRMLDWWTKEDGEHFRASGEALAAQFDAYKPFPDLAVNGHQTLSENIADVAGLLAAYDAYRLSLNGKDDAVKDGLTGDQRFFISFAQSWRDQTREAELRRRIATDGHAPDQYRASTVRNLDPWYAAFSVQPSNKLYLAPSARVHVW